VTASDAGGSSPPARSASAWALLLAVWAASRWWVIEHAVDRLPRTTLFNDINLVWAWAHQAPFGDDPAPTLTEYPGLARLLATSALLTPDPVSFGWAWIGVMLVVDLVLLLVLARSGTRPAWLWVVGGAALGPVVWLRYDLLVAALAVGAVALRRGRPGWSGVLLGLAVLLKLWPLVLVAALLPGRAWRRWAVAAGGTLALGVVAEALVVGRASLLAPFAYQSGRGLQVESLPATPLLWASRGEPPTQVWEFAFRAYQLQDSAGSGWDLLGLVLVGLVGAAVLLLQVRARGMGEAGQDALRASSAALVAAALVAANTVFSPQYVLWFLPLAALAAAAASVPRAVDAVLVGIAALTHVIWPWYYVDLLNLVDGTLLVLTLRNGLMVLLVVLLALVVARQAGGAQLPGLAAGDAPDRPEAAPERLGRPAQPGRNDSRT
jgi:hypothetical protein